MKRIGLLFSLVAALAAPPVMAGEPAMQFNDKGELHRPGDFRSWPFLNASLGLTYGPNRPRNGGPPVFSNVFVDPESLRSFNQTGIWPDGTFFILELRQVMEHAAIGSEGKTQGARVAIEAAVKDSRRYPDGGWAYFDFGRADQPRAQTTPLARTAGCYGCHSKHGAVEWSFTQFYAEQFEIARQHGTVRKDYDPKRVIE